MIEVLTYDVAIIGGGIAGAAATLALTKTDLNVVWMRPKLDPNSYKVGESLAPAANPILDQLGISDLIKNGPHRHSNSTFSAWGQSSLVERSSVIHLEGPGHIIDRAIFETDLNQLAEQSGATIVNAMLQQLMERNGLWLLETSELGVSDKYSAKFIIDASGRTQAVGKSLARQNFAKTKTDDHLVTAYAFLEQDKDNDVIPTPATLIESTQSGWWYASMLPNNTLSLNYYSDPDLMPKGVHSDLDVWSALISETQYISHWIKDAQFHVSRPPSLTSAATRWLAPAAGIGNSAGWAAIGDAAASFDPLSAHGMTTALWAAAQTPQLVQSFLDGNMVALEKYAHSVETGRKEYLNQRSKMYSAERRFTNSPFWDRRAMR